MFSSLQALGISSLNEMQETSLKAHRETDHIILLSPTGSGKTLAFLLPLLENLASDNTKAQAIILTPSRELALQIEQVFRSLKSGFKVVCCYGGHDINAESRSLAYTPTLIIGTPGRILDHTITSPGGQLIRARSPPSFSMSLIRHWNSVFKKTWKPSSRTCHTCKSVS